MRTILAFTGLLLVVGLSGVSAQERKGITAYREAIDLTPEGSALVRIRVTLAGWDADRIDLPLNFGNPENFAVEAGGAAAGATAARAGDVRVIRLQFARQPAAVENVTVTFTAAGFFDWARARTPRGIYRMSYTFINPTATTVGNYAAIIRLPEDFRITGITSSTPRMTGEELEPPYEFVTQEGRVALHLRSRSVPPGRLAAIAFGFERDGRHPLPVIAIGIVIALLALYLKRDVLTSRDFEKEVAA